MSNFKKSISKVIEVSKPDRLSWIGRLLGAIVVVSIFTFFRLLGQQDDIKVQHNIETLLRNEINASNPYMLSKTMSDLQGIGLVHCAKITLKSTETIYYNSFIEGRCSNFKPSMFEIQSVNGFKYIIEFEKRINIYALCLEIFIYLSLGVLLSFSKTFLRKMHLENQLKVQILEIEKKYLSSQARQVSHDIASPLSAIRLVSGLVKNIDPEVKDILNKSILRTQEIFDELKGNKDEILSFDLSAAVREVVGEKMLLWGNTCEIELVISESGKLYSVGNSARFKRIFSNVLNNAQEALVEARPGKVVVSCKVDQNHAFVVIEDNGRGMDQDTLAKIGEEGFSLGKESHASAGSGIGVASSINELSKWNGSLEYSSTVGVGTKAVITLLRGADA